MSSPQPAWAERYAGLAEYLLAMAPSTGPHLLGFNSCVDRIHRLDADGVDRLEKSAHEASGVEREFARAILDRIGSGGDGELFTPWPEGSAWAEYVFGPGVRDQIGGTGAQAAWVMSLLGATTIVATQDRSQAQLAVLPADTRIVEGDHLVRPAQAVTGETWVKFPHHIVEYAAGLVVGGRELTRSSALIVRFMNDGIEEDRQFRDRLAQHVTSTSTLLISGMNGIDLADHAAMPWLSGVVDDVRALRARDGVMAAIHLELAEYPHEGDVARMCEAFAGRADSMGFNLSEALDLGRPGEDVTAVAARLATTYDAREIFVHADTWSMCVHRDDPARAVTRLMSGNLLAGNRAAAGEPVAVPVLVDGATFSDDHPASGDLPGGWRVDVVPSVYLERPVATIGLGDAFAAGSLLGATMPLPGPEIVGRT
ncbi:MAG TPA: ADP-dependent glucokinase/phosphofructokinase [Jiangellaceae bacterium]